MATYFVGDLHGCFDELQLLLEKVRFNSDDFLYLTGDLIARGEKSLECLRFVKSLGNQAQTVLGNHDLHLLSCAYGIKKVKPRDNLTALFAAEDFAELIDWLRFQPLFVHHEQLGFSLSHAAFPPIGILPLHNLALKKWKRCCNMAISNIYSAKCTTVGLIVGRRIYRVLSACVIVLTYSPECAFVMPIIA